MRIVIDHEVSIIYFFLVCVLVVGLGCVESEISYGGCV